ncbi:hypothetical protein LWI28_026882 [Acer negundo]|uniref:Uncharacterized protein n=1 Tax=Acer negundo TaxID=4023 RepID=A0AAD5NPB0_ACENE|nr:hypothetical protein LWI28_026882 [Acer negundo]
MDWSGRWRGEEVVNKKEEKGSAYVVRSLESIELLFCSYGSYSVGGQHSLWVPIMSVHSLQHWTLQSYLSLTKTPHCVNICAAAKPQPLDLRSSYVRFRGVVVTTRSYFTGTGRSKDVVYMVRRNKVHRVLQISWTEHAKLKPNELPHYKIDIYS